MNVKKIIVFLVLLSNFSHHSYAQHIPDVQLFKTIAKVLSHHKNNAYKFTQEELIAHNAYHVFQTKTQRQELQTACMYGVLAQVKKGKQQQIFIYPAKALSCLSLYPTQELWRPYVLASRAVDQDITPWKSPRSSQATEKFKDC
jgi:hypothetical protein